MTLNRMKIVAYSILVRAEKYILSESDRKNTDQILVPSEYVLAVAEYMVNN